MPSGALLILIALGPAVPAADDAKPQDPPAVVAAEKVQGHLVTVDTDAKKVTIKRTTTEGSAAELSLVMEGDAVAAAAKLQAGDSVTVTCREGTKDETCVAVDVKKNTP